MPELSPSGLNSYKNNMATKEEIFSNFKEQLQKEPALSSVNKIINKLKEGKDVYIICGEKNLCDCHRRILAKHISEIAKIEWKEYREE